MAADAELNLSFIEKKLGTVGRISYYAGLVGLYSLIPLIKNDIGMLAGGVLEKFNIHPEQIVKIEKFGDFSSDLHGFIGLVLGLLLVFRTNSSYSRWWEARKLWGKLVNVSRNMAIKFRELTNFTREELRELADLLVAFPESLRDHLREDDDFSMFPELEQIDPPPRHIPAYIADLIYRRVISWKRTGIIDGDEMRIIDSETRELMEICGACERIRRTRLSPSYRTFVRHCITLYLVTLPWGLVEDFKIWTVPMTVIMAYFMIGIEVIAHSVEEPFGLDEDDLDLDGLCITIRSTVNEILDRFGKQESAQS
ncbi:bestrophin [Gimesia panareensis]|uniref:Bestrophin, RFP-TM, chloride channel n=1 Tax=Gimesia panareensis TaxID=2527978 RepID=A0A517Q991_9PLAN|nr:bestrophin [Gimesia panareensis]QDT28198.1 Bestrophin, RFP-TM, chloride channel [Gimesia panareensis]QDU51065.1 Bestrophin, RFP-TM, chloride channel [Gimesia panareensis]